MQSWRMSNAEKDDYAAWISLFAVWHDPKFLCCIRQVLESPREELPGSLGQVSFYLTHAWLR